jgi:predicted nucleotidyltransferase
VIPLIDFPRVALAAARAEIPDLELAIVFGSAAAGRARYESDLDVAIRCAGVADLDALFLALAPRLKTNRLDLVDLRHAGPLLAFEVARSGVLLYERSPGLFRQFQSLASRRYADAKRLRDAQKRSIEVFLEQIHAHESR